MKNILNKWQKFEFEYRIFISLSIVLVICILSGTVFNQLPSIPVFIGSVFGLNPVIINKVLFLLLSVCMFGISILRMWAGSILNSQTVMSFRVQSNSLSIEGPYLLVRNPIYLSDLLAMCCFALCLPVIGFFIPVLFYVHYIQLIKYEESALKNRFDENYQEYVTQIPRLVPSEKSIKHFIQSRNKVKLNRDGIRHNAQYVLFVPGFIIAAILNDFLYAVLVGLPAVIDWAVIHTIIGLKKSPKSDRDIDTHIIDKPKLKGKVFNDILYAQCWEDPSIDRTAFDIQSHDTVFSITSGGCNVLTFLLDNPKKIIALDLNPRQNYLLELKIACFKKLTYSTTLEFLGVNKSVMRLEIYKALRPGLSQEAQKYWDQNEKKIRNGIIHTGHYEHYMRLLRKLILFFFGKSLIQQFYQVQSTEERLQLYNKKWNNLWWKIFTKILLSKAFMSFFFDKAFFKYLEENFSFGDHFAAKVKHAFTELPIRENYFLSYILLGNYYQKKYLPLYLCPENYNLIRSRVDRVQLVNDSCDNYFSSLPDAVISKFNFTNIFEWMSVEAFENLLRETIRVARPDAIITYRNLLVPREHPQTLNDNIISKRILARHLHQKDLSFIYNNYVVEQIRKDDQTCHSRLKRYQTEKH